MEKCQAVVYIQLYVHFKCPLQGEETAIFTETNDFHYFHLSIVFLIGLCGIKISLYIIILEMENK